MHGVREWAQAWDCEFVNSRTSSHIIKEVFNSLHKRECRQQFSVSDITFNFCLLMNTLCGYAISSRNDLGDTNERFLPSIPALTPAFHSPQISATGSTINSPCFLSRRHLLDLNLRHRCASARQIGLLGLGVLGIIIADGTLDGIFGQHAAMQLNRRET